MDAALDRDRRLVRESIQRRWSGAFAPVAHVDGLLLLVTALLCGLGLLMVYSARVAATPEVASALLGRQLVALLLGAGLMIAVATPDYRIYRAWGPVAYGVTLGLLAGVLLFGEEINGARAWFVLGPLQFQPAELAKVSLIVVLAAHFHEYREEALGLRALVEALAFAAAPMLLILLQPDFGTFVVFVVITFGVLLMARVHVRYLIALVILGALASFAALQLGIVKEYQLDRLTAFLNPEAADAQGAGYNVTQATIAVGSGQFFGQGLFAGSQTAQGFVPENHTDFIFTVVGEQTGFAGSALMLLLFAVLLWRGLRIAALSRDTFGTLLAAGVIVTFAFQMFVSVGMATGIMPVTGLPLPFISYGGTSLIASLAMVGLLQNVHMRRFTR